MNKAHLDLIRKRYENAVHEYCLAFCQKHGFEYNPDDWVGGDIGGVLNINDDYFFDFDDIRYDIDHNIAEEVFLQWYDYDTEVALVEGAHIVNYHSWCMGYRPYTAEQLKAMGEAQCRIRKMQAELEEMAKNYNKKGL